MVVLRTEEADRAWATATWPEVDWARSEVRVAAFHHVVLSESGAVSRGAVGLGHTVQVPRELAILEVVGGLGLAVTVPTVLSGVRGDEAMTAILISRTAGDHGPDRPWDRRLAATYTALLADLRGVAPGRLTGLPPPRTWCGGPDWPEVVDRVTLALPRQLRELASRLVSDVAEIEAGVAGCFVHGDFGPHNLLWRAGEAVSLLDFDHACLGDPAVDLAPLVGFYGSVAVRPVTERDLLDRAMMHRATLSLQVACAAQLTGHETLRDHALANFAARAEAGTLYDPDGDAPS